MIVSSSRDAFTGLTKWAAKPISRACLASSRKWLDVSMIKGTCASWGSCLICRPKVSPSISGIFISTNTTA